MKDYTKFWPFVRRLHNLGLSETLQAAFPLIVPVVRPSFINDKSIDPNWLAGFTRALGCFILGISNASDRKAGGQVRLSFYITQHLRDEQLMISLVKFFGCGAVYKNRETFRYLVSKFSDIHEKIIPFLKYPVLLKSIRISKIDVRSLKWWKIINT